MSQITSNKYSSIFLLTLDLLTIFVDSLFVYIYNLLTLSILFFKLCLFDDSSNISEIILLSIYFSFDESIV